MNKELLIQNYFSRQLTPEQERRFEELLATDSDFKAQFDFEKDLQRIIREEKISGLKTKLQGFENDLANDTPVVKLRSTNYGKWAMAASVALLVGLGWLGYHNFAGPDYDSLYEENFNAYPNTVYAITRGEATASNERDAFSAYELGEYQKAIDNFNRIPKADRKEYLDFYLGLSHLNLGQTSEAKTFFEKAIALETEFTPEAHWYLVMIALKEKNKESAIIQLKELTTQYDYNKDLALELLNELE